MTFNERRKSKRIAAALGLEEAVMVEVNGQQYPASLVNLGLGGALLDLRGCAPAFHNAVVSLYFENGGNILTLKAAVVRSDGRHVAFAFSNTTERDKEQIQAKVIRMSILASRLAASQAPHPFTKLMPFGSHHSLTTK
jgi:c-di-GMP-binding flagellar brake protein YcgR